jgi:hypothetical protein
VAAADASKLACQRRSRAPVLRRAGGHHRLHRHIASEAMRCRDAHAWQGAARTALHRGQGLTRNAQARTCARMRRAAQGWPHASQVSKRKSQMAACAGARPREHTCVHASAGGSRSAFRHATGA